MARISRTENNMFDIPDGAMVAKDGRVYIDASFYLLTCCGVIPNTRRKKICIGLSCEDEDGQLTGKMYANQNYYDTILRHKDD